MAQSIPSEIKLAGTDYTFYFDTDVIKSSVRLSITNKTGLGGSAFITNFLDESKKYNENICRGVQYNVNIPKGIFHALEQDLAVQTPGYWEDKESSIFVQFTWQPYTEPAKEPETNTNTDSEITVVNTYEEEKIEEIKLLNTGFYRNCRDEYRIKKPFYQGEKYAKNSIVNDNIPSTAYGDRIGTLSLENSGKRKRKIGINTKFNLDMKPDKDFYLASTPDRINGRVVIDDIDISIEPTAQSYKISGYYIEE